MYFLKSRREMRQIQIFLKIENEYITYLDAQCMAENYIFHSHEKKKNPLPWI